jgi:hypothetical protein
MEPNPLDELYRAAMERKNGRFKVITAAYVVEMIELHNLRQNAVKAVSSDLNR